MCIFCEMVKDRTKMKTEPVFEDAAVMAFLDVDPIHEGHILVIPKEHYLDADELPEEVLSRIMQLSQKIVAALREIYHPDGYSILQNGGAFNDVGHYHLHIFPRYKNDGFGWTYPKGAFRCDADVAEAIREKLG